MIQGLVRLTLLKPVLKPLTRLFVGIIAVPLFRLFLRKGIRVETLDHELERDLEQWFRGSLILLVATANMEQTLFGWVPLDLQGDQAWVVLLFRLLLAVSVIEVMPDQQLFAILHPGPPKLRFGRGMIHEAWEQRRAIAKGLLCQHLNRSSAVFAITAAILGGPPGSTAATVGWICYGLAIAQYLVIGLVTSRDKAMDVITAFDRSVAEQREDLLEEFLGVEGEADGGREGTDSSKTVFPPAKRCEVRVAMTDDTESDGELPAVGIMGHLEPEARSKLAAAGRFVVADPGDYLAVQGQHHHSLAVIISGEVSITAHAHGDSVELATLREGHTVGEMSVIDPRAASANARVSKPAKLWIIKGEDFDKLVEGDRATGMAIYRLLARELCQRLRHDSENMLRREDEMRSKFLDMDY